MEKTAKIYIAGHSGLVGSAVLSALKAEGFSNLVVRTHKELDLMDEAKVKEFFEKEQPEYVILSAAKVGGIKANMAFMADFLYENLKIQNNIIWQSHLNGVKKLLFLGSCCVYPRDCPQPMKPEYFLTGKFEPSNEGYAVAKTAGIKLCEYIYSQYGQKFISCLPANIYGHGDHFDPEYSHVHGALMRRIHEAKIQNLPEVTVWGTGQSRREFLSSQDLGEALLWMMQNYEQKEFLNIGTGQDISIYDLAYLLKDIIGYQGKLVFDASKPDGMPQKLLDVSKINALGWKSKIAIKEGLADLYQWFLENAADKK